MDLFFNLIVAHIIGDFFFQTDKSCRRKLEKGTGGVDLYLHSFIIFLLSWMAVWNLSFWWAALIIAVLHFLIDVLKIKIEKNYTIKDDEGQKISLGESRFSICPFVVDQFLHIAIIGGITYWWQQSNDWNQFTFIEELGRKKVAFVLALMLCSKPANILTRHILGYCKVKGVQTDEDHGTFKSGALIGTLERWLVVFFMCIQQYEAIGFLMAAKSILRFSETKESEKSEYVLAGTFLSVTIALACGWMVLNL